MGAIGALCALAAPMASAAPTATPAATPNPTAARAAMDLARFHYGNRDYKQAARLFHQAYGLDPVPDYLFNAARAEQRGFELDDAERDYRAFLALDTISDESRRRATVHLAEVQETRARLAEERRREAEGRAAAPAPTPTPTTPAPAPAAPSSTVKIEAGNAGASWRRPLGYGLGGLAAVGLGYAAWAGLGARGAQAALDNDVAVRGPDGKVIGLDFATYRGRQTAIYDDRDRAVAVGATGLALAAGSAYLLLGGDGPARAALLPLRGGALLTVRVGFDGGGR